MKELPHTHSCFVCGESNPLGMKLRFHTDGREVHARFVPRPEHNGFKGVVHGGLIATVLDEIMVWACAVRTRQFSYCAELTVRFQNPLRPGEEVLAVGELVTNRKGKIFEAHSSLRNAAGTVFAEATGKYLPVKNVALSELVGDVVGDAGWLFANSTT